MWRFIDLSDSQKLERRHSLDLYAAIAQSAVLIPLFGLQIWFLGGWLRFKLKLRGHGRGLGGRKSSIVGVDHGDDDEFEIPSSPFAKHERSLGHNGRGGGVRFWLRLRQWGRRVGWWCGEGKIGALGFEAMRGEVLFAAVWTGLLLGLCVVGTGDDYLHLTKRFGIVGASQLPLHYLLALKTPYSPLQLLTRRSWESLNSLHQLLGRIMTLLFHLHAIFYLNFFIQANLLAKRMKNLDVILGLVAITFFTVLGTTALSFVRRRNYRVFYAVHVILATLLLPVLYFHVSHIRLYIWQTLAVWSINVLTRTVGAKTVAGAVGFVPGTTDLIDIRIPVSGGLKKGKKGKALIKWQPGQHVHVSLLQREGHLLTRPVRSKNPFTIASLPGEAGGLRLVARVLDGKTAALAQEARSEKGGDVQLGIEGPYGLTTHSEKLLRCSRVLFVAGGVGATFIVPLYINLLRDLSPSAGSRRRQNIKFVWTVRDEAETKWAIPDDESEARGVGERLSVFVTRGVSAARVGEDEDGYMGLRSKSERLEDEEGGVELEQLLPAGAARDAHKGRKLDVHIGRPDLRALVNETFNGTGDKDRVAVFVCGPKGLAEGVRQEVGRWIEKREVWFWNEEFGLS